MVKQQPFVIFKMKARPLRGVLVYVVARRTQRWVWPVWVN